MSFKENLEKLKQFLAVIRGTVDIRDQLSWLFNPSNPKTASNLSTSQAEFVEDAYFVTGYFPRFKPLQDLALEILLTTPSIKGRRVEDAIQYRRASKGEMGSQIGIFQGMKEKVVGKKEAKDIEQ